MVAFEYTSANYVTGNDCNISAYANGPDPLDRDFYSKWNIERGKTNIDVYYLSEDKPNYVAKITLTQGKNWYRIAIAKSADFICAPNGAYIEPSVMLKIGHKKCALFDDSGYLIGKH